MKDPTCKLTHILAALSIGLMLCLAVTMLFCLSEMKHVTGSNNTIYEAERATDSVHSK